MFDWLHILKFWTISVIANLKYILISLMRSISQKGCHPKCMRGLFKFCCTVLYGLYLQYILQYWVMCWYHFRIRFVIFCLRLPLILFFLWYGQYFRCREKMCELCIMPYKEEIILHFTRYTFILKAVLQI